MRNQFTVIALFLALLSSSVKPTFAAPPPQTKSSNDEKQSWTYWLSTKALELAGAYATHKLVEEVARTLPSTPNAIHAPKGDSKPRTYKVKLSMGGRSSSSSSSDIKDSKENQDSKKSCSSCMLEATLELKGTKQQQGQRKRALTVKQTNQTSELRYLQLPRHLRELERQNHRGPDSLQPVMVNIGPGLIELESNRHSSAQINELAVFMQPNRLFANHRLQVFDISPDIVAQIQNSGYNRARARSVTNFPENFGQETGTYRELLSDFIPQIPSSLQGLPITATQADLADIRFISRSIDQLFILNTLQHVLQSLPVEEQLEVILNLFDSLKSRGAMFVDSFSLGMSLMILFASQMDFAEKAAFLKVIVNGASFTLEIDGSLYEFYFLKNPSSRERVDPLIMMLAGSRVPQLRTDDGPSDSSHLYHVRRIN